MIEVYREQAKPFEERADFKELSSVTKDRKRDKKKKEKKSKRDMSSESNEKGEAQNTSDLLMSQSQFVSQRHIVPDTEAGPVVPENFFEE